MTRDSNTPPASQPARNKNRKRTMMEVRSDLSFPVTRLSKRFQANYVDGRDIQLRNKIFLTAVIEHFAAGLIGETDRLAPPGQDDLRVTDVDRMLNANPQLSAQLRRPLPPRPIGFTFLKA